MASMIPIKSYLSKDIRRFALPRDAGLRGLNAAFQEIYSDAFTPNHFVQYVDDEGDQIAVSSEEEWQECLRLNPQPPLRLTLVDKTRKRRVVHRSDTAQLIDVPTPTVATPVEVPVLEIQETDTPLDAISSLSVESLRDPSPTPAQSQPSTTTVAIQEESECPTPTLPSSGVADTSSDEGSEAPNSELMYFYSTGSTDPTQIHSPERLNRLKEVVPGILRQFTPEETNTLPDWLQNSVVMRSQGLDDVADVDLMALAECLDRRAMSCLDNNDFTGALEAFTAELAVADETQTVTLLYNIACMHSRMNSLDEALVFLRRAIDGGYRDSVHLSSDSDFDNVRGTQAFVSMLEEIRKNPGTQVAEPEDDGWTRLDAVLPTPSHVGAAVDPPMTNNDDDVEDAAVCVSPASPQETPRTAHNRAFYSRQLDHLHVMGFHDDVMNIRALVDTAGVLEPAVGILVRPE